MRRRRVVLVAAVALLTACPPSTRHVDAWVECIECTAGELDSVVAHGQASISTLLRYATLGPPSDRTARLRHTEDSTRARLQAWSVAHAGVDSSALVSFTDYYAASYDRLYRVRATIALARIRTPQALAAIDSALAHAPSVRLRERLALARDSAR